ncbi:hypothetical protein NKR23_g4057 [Pleurostoma richardsiae]|uniref:Uncharacterized protein n=1 Tax=Pleurostoma richardsiae TaxID=41990 RepID=A0AA38VSJ2_9PEZI|nr:hypothetical protein NKR23_g4057 [Pleurostoma richardsiae]
MTIQRQQLHDDDDSTKRWCRSGLIVSWVPGHLISNGHHFLMSAHKPNAWYSNALYLAGIVLSYSSTSLIFLSLNTHLAQVLDFNYGREGMGENEIHVNAIALLTFGLGLLAQALITTWAFMRTDIPTWSSNPLDVVKECMDDNQGHRVTHQLGRCMMSVHQFKDATQNCRPRSPQRPLIKAHHSVRWVFALLWILPPLGGLWGGTVLALLYKGDKNGVLGRSWDLLPSFTGSTDFECSAYQCTDGTSILNVGWTAYSGILQTIGSLFLITGFQSVVTLSLHCAELIVNLSRDEGVYRKLIGPRGTNGHYNSIIAACTSWQTIFLFAFKAGVHWMFGLAINVSFKLGVNMYPPQIFYFTGFSLVAAVFCTYLSCRRSSGYLPSSFGHIQTIANIIDEWADSGCMYWGHKADGRFPGDPSYAGTSTRRLPPPFPNRFYGGRGIVSPEELAYNLGLQVGQNQNRLSVGSDSRGERPSPPPPYEQANPVSMSSSQHSWSRPSNGSLNSNYSYQSQVPLMYNRY